MSFVTFRGKRNYRSGGFTLLEVLSVMAVLAIIAGIITLNFDRLIAAAEFKPLDRVLLETIQEARIQAATEGYPVYLSYEPETEKFALTTRQRPEVAADTDDFLTITEPKVNRYGFRDSDGVQVLFYPKISKSTELSAGDADFSRDPVPALAFHPSGVSTPARIVIRQDGADDLEFVLDPMSSGPLEIDS